MSQDLFIELLQVALGTRSELSLVPSNSQWEALLELAQMQAVEGVLLCGIERLPKEQRPPMDILMQWFGRAHIIESHNGEMTKTCVSVCERFVEDGYRICVLKGQANRVYYPAEIGKRRPCGDVDVWVKVMSDGSCKKDDIKQVLKYVKSKHGLTGLCWLHCKFEDKSGVSVEVHFHPSFMNEPIHNRRFQRYFADFDSCVTYKEIEGKKIPALRVEKDVIYQMNHIYRHLLDEGIGLRQIIDYFCCLRNYSIHLKKGIRSKEETIRIVKWLGMRRFAGALMWVLQVVCGMSSENLLCQPVEKDGKFLMNEIMMSGNFGQSDPRMGELNTSSVMKYRLTRAWRRFKRNIRFVSSYPSEVAWEPFARLYHFAWKKLKLYNC